ncbi:GNAT family N-acetyltransferase [Pseudenhygromyxa sp. WMMC2535]|nr:GNAT family N-acetyltransferase [Pseudenhygromyxa sp. WMMC2535]
MDSRGQIAAFYADRERALHVYELGDLDDAFWPRTRWYGLPDADEPAGLSALALLYDQQSLLLLGCEADQPARAELLAALEPSLPARLHVHLSPGLLALLPASRWRVEPRGPHLKMALRSPAAVPAPDPAAHGMSLVRLGEADLDELLAFYERAYPESWFDPRSLATGVVHGLREGGTGGRTGGGTGALRSVAGIHVFSPAQGVAAIGNVATDPQARGRGLARTVTAATCRALAEHVDLVGLNVHADNLAARRCYAGLGFEVVGRYEEAGIARVDPAR